MDGDTVIADAYFQTIINGVAVEDDYGIFKVDPVKGTYHKVTSMRVMEGCMAEDKFYFLPAIKEKGLWSVSLGGGEAKQVTLPGMDKSDYMVDCVTAYGGRLYIGSYYGNHGYVISYDIKTGESRILADTPGRIGKLCTDGENLYAYYANFPYNQEGYIKTVKLKYY